MSEPTSAAENEVFVCHPQRRKRAGEQDDPRGGDAMNVGDRGRCQQCGGKIVLIRHPGIISLAAGLWVHTGAVRRVAATHPAVGPS